MSDSVMETDKRGNKAWKNLKGQLHRIDDPTIEYLDGYKVWHFRLTCC